MRSGSTYYETNLYRCLDYNEKQTDDIYLTFCGVEQCLPGYEYFAGNRPGYHIHVILSSKGILCVNGKKESLHSGQMFVTKQGEDSWYRADEHDPWTYCWMTFDGTQALRYLDNAGLPQGINCRDCYTEPGRFYTCVKGILDHQEMNLANDLKRLSLLLDFIALAIESDAMKLTPARQESDYNADVYVEKAEAYIRFNFSNVKIADVARNIGINRSYLTKIFKNKKGISPQEYLMQCKLSHACKFLLETDAMIQDIAKRVGYDDLLTFSKIFKSKYGVSPKKYREQHRLKENNE